jgi:hypothetical protein
MAQLSSLEKSVHVLCVVEGGGVSLPVGGCGHGEAFRAGFEGEEFAGYDPGDGAP